MAAFPIGSAVLRIENRAERRATIEAIDTAPEEPIYHLIYSEGGDGWWPESALEAGELGTP